MWKVLWRSILKVGDFDSLLKAGDLLERAGRREEALQVFKRALNLAPPLKRGELEKRIERLSEGKREGLIERLRRGLKKTKEVVRIGEIFSGRAVDESLFEELEETLVRADVGVKTVLSLIEDIKREAKRKSVKRSEDLKEITGRAILDLISGCEGDLNLEGGRPKVFLFLGVNGSGKTTTIGKLAYRFVGEGKRVLLVAGDTFRAAAIEQLEAWARRSGSDIVKGEEGSDPASVVYKGLE
ncbi:MAG: signal recognition particle receptor subunit alpha, partial [Aquificota bacterium]|nr:signal recognition particle receptor subunit alpha [Aquificota bacterium]